MVASSQDQLNTAMEHLVRIALDNVLGGYVGVVPAAASGKTMRSIPMVDTEIVKQRLTGEPNDWTLLDVRDADEQAATAIDGSKHIYVGELSKQWRDLDPSRSYTLMCASGMRRQWRRVGSMRTALTMWMCTWVRLARGKLRRIDRQNLSRYPTDQLRNQLSASAMVAPKGAQPFVRRVL